MGANTLSDGMSLSEGTTLRVGFLVQAVRSVRIWEAGLLSFPAKTEEPCIPVPASE